MKRLFGDDVNKIVVPGMEADSISKYGVNIFQDLKPEDVPMRPEAVDIFGRRFPDGPELAPSTHCLPLGIPLVTMLAEVSKIVQTPGLIVIMLELNNGYRQVYTDGRKLPADPSPSWLGYSVGRWEEDTLVVDTIGLNDKGWLISLAIRKAKPCILPNDTGGAISGTWKWKSLWTIPKCTPSRLRSK